MKSVYKEIEECKNKKLTVLDLSSFTTVRLLLKQNQLVRKFMSKLVQIGSVKQLI